MKKKDKKNKEEKKVDVVETPSLEIKMDSMIAGLNTVAGALGKLVDLQTADKKTEAKTERNSAGLTFNAKLDDETYPSAYIPPKFRKIVDDLLSPDFGLQIIDFTDRTDFQVNIIVPDKYSSVSKEDREKGIKDIRSRMVPRALGENGLKDWCSLIRRNLSKFYTQEGVQSPFTN